eukprot:2006626-Amphidinium_carterae.1
MHKWPVYVFGTAHHTSLESTIPRDYTICHVQTWHEDTIMRNVEATPSVVEVNVPKTNHKPPEVAPTSNEFACKTLTTWMRKAMHDGHPPIQQMLILHEVPQLVKLPCTTSGEIDDSERELTWTMRCGH